MFPNHIIIIIILMHGVDHREVIISVVHIANLCVTVHV